MLPAGPAPGRHRAKWGRNLLVRRGPPSQPPPLGGGTPEEPRVTYTRQSTTKSVDSLEGFEEEGNAHLEA